MRSGSAVVAALALLVFPAQGADWKTLEAQLSVPNTPADWREKEPSREAMDQWRGPEAARLVKLATDLEGFAVEHPDDPALPAVREKESEALYAASRLGHLGAENALGVLDRIRLSDPKLDEETRLAIRSRQVEASARIHARESTEAGQKAYLEGARALAKEFPSRREPWTMLVEMADGDSLPLSRAILEEVRAGNGPEETRAYAEAVSRRLESLGKPLELKFTAVDGRVVDLKTLRGHVVLLDFWGSFCGPCMARLPELKEMYDKLHAEGLEIAGINFDEEPLLVGAFAKDRGLSWPQFCDGRGWQNEFGVRYGIHALPAMWLVDRRGILRDLHAGTKLAEKVKVLLEEKS